MVLNEKSAELMVVNGTTGDILGHHSIPLFKKEDLSMAYLVVCADEVLDGEQGQYLVDFSDIIYVNEQHAIAVRKCVEDVQGGELSLDEYTELIGLPVRYDDGAEIGRLTEIQYNTETGAFDMAVVESERKTTELLRRQIESADNYEIIVRRKLEAPVEKMQPSRVWFRRPVAEKPAVEEPAISFELVNEEPIIEEPAMEPIIEEPAIEEPAVDLISEETVRAIDNLDAFLREETPAAEEMPIVGEEWPEINDTFAPEPEAEPVPAEAESALGTEEAGEVTEQIPLYEQKFAGVETEEPAEQAEPEQPTEQAEQPKKQNEKKEKGGKGFWKRGF